jgi:hypothetical protein
MLLSTVTYIPRGFVDLTIPFWAEMSVFKPERSPFDDTRSKKQQARQKEAFEYAEREKSSQETEKGHQGWHSQTQNSLIDHAFDQNQQPANVQASFERLK